MKKNQIFICALFALSIIITLSCSKDEQIEPTGQNETTVIDKASILAGLQENGVDISKEFSSTEKAAATFLEAFAQWGMAYQDVWAREVCHFNSSFCAPAGRTYRIRFSIYSYTEQKFYSQFTKTVTKQCWTSGSNTVLTDYIISGDSQDIVVLAEAWTVSTTNPSDIIYQGYAVSNQVENVPLEGISMPTLP